MQALDKNQVADFVSAFICFRRTVGGRSRLHIFAAGELTARTSTRRNENSWV